ncbi:MAG TPA: DUF5719 family protein, partial [Acidimicrobiales bacterium]|nr:DUF5719 family protein [Acidimicrobiales bacterium]
VTPRLPFLVLATVAVGSGVLVGADLTGGAERPSVARAPIEAAAASAGDDPAGAEHEPLNTPEAQGDHALSSTWYCAAGTAYGDGSAEHTVVVANPTDAEVAGTLTVYPGDVAPPRPGPLDDPAAAEATTTTTAPELPDAGRVQEDFSVPARSRVEYRLSDLVTAQLASATVEADSGGVTVEHQVDSPVGSDVAPCASAASPTWYFAWGATSRDARELLVLFNPFPSDVIVDAVFSTEGGVREPLRWQGLTVPARSVVGVDVGDDVTRREQVSATLRARSGRLIVDRLQVFDGSGDTAGVSVALGQTAPGHDWLFSHGRVGDGVDERIVLYNPGRTTAEVEVSVEAVDSAKRPPQPFGVVVRPGRYEVVDYADESRVEPGVTHGTAVRSSNGVPVVAERVMTYDGPPARASGPARRELSITPPTAVAATEWSFPAAGGAEDEVLRYTVMNPAPDRPARVSLTLFAGGRAVDVPDLSGVTVAPGERVTLELPADALAPVGPDGTVVIHADGPVTAERIVLRDGLPTTIGPGIPVGPGTVALDDVP